MDFKKWLALILCLHVLVISSFIFIDGNPQRPDSGHYRMLASKICENAPYESRAERYRTGYFSPDDAVEESYSGKQNLVLDAPEIFRTPGYPAFLCALHKMGLNSDYEVVGGQLFLLYFAILCFYFMAKRLYGAPVAGPATLVLLASPGGLVYSMTLYSEVLFLFFLLIAVLAFLLYLQELSLGTLVLSGVFFGLAFYVRAAVVYIPFLLCLLTLLFLRQRFTLKAGHMLLFIALFAGMVSPWILRNYSHYGTFYISGQLSNTLAIWHLPDVWAQTQGKDPKESRVVVRSEIDKRVEQYERENQVYVDNVGFYTIQQQYAIEKLSEDLPAYVKKWLYGMKYTLTDGYIGQVYFMFTGDPVRPFTQSAALIESDSKLLRLVLAVVQQPEQALLKVFMYTEELLWIIFVVLALVPVLSGAVRFDVSAWVILAVVSYFIFIPGTMGYSRFRFAVDWLIILQAVLGIKMLHQRFYSSA